MVVKKKTKALPERRTIGKIFSQIGEVFRPPKRITVAEAAGKYFHLPEGGRYDIDTTPYMKTPMNKLTDRNVSAIIFAGTARSGKTLALIGGSLAYIITCNPSDTLIVHMTEAAARKYSRFTIARMIRNSPKILALLSPSKDDDNVLMKFFRNGMGLVIGHPSPTQLSAADYKFVFLSDFDRMVEDNGEGSVFIQAQKRTQTFMSAGCTVAESSPGRDFLDTEWKRQGEHEAPPVGGILGLYNEGDRHMQYWTCPHCQGDIKLYPGLDLHMLPDHETLIHEILAKGAQETAKKYASIWCPNHGCGAEITESYKHRLNMADDWRPETDIPNSTASFWLSGYASAFQTWASILEKEFKGQLHFVSTGDENKLKATRNVDQGIPHMPAGLQSRITPQQLENRAEDIPQYIVPKKGRFLVASIDVQKYKFVVQVEAYGVGYESWLIDRFDIDISERFQSDTPKLDGSDAHALLQPPSYLEDWDLIRTKVIERRYMVDDDSGRDMGIIITVCDSHGAEGVTENAYKFWKKMKNLGHSDRFHLIRGLRPRPNATTPYVSKIVLDKSSRSARSAKIVGEQAVWNVNTTLYKDMVMAHINRDKYGENFLHFGDWLESRVYSEFLAENRTDKGWDNLSARKNEGFDLLAYSRAAVKIKLLGHWQSDINWDAPPPWADIWDRNPDVSDPEERQVKKSAPVKTAERTVRMRSKR